MAAGDLQRDDLQYLREHLLADVRVAAGKTELADAVVLDADGVADRPILLGKLCSIGREAAAAVVDLIHNENAPA
ncbi:MAG: hypothetical protein IJD20_05140, partial [Oscillospiraceae bacterium]|nr:hypothetical protein [Oscillospiraceae bacterium]